MELNANQLAILKSRYLRRNEQGDIIETPEEMFWRVAKTVAAAEANFGADSCQVAAWADKFYDMMRSLEFLPNSPTLMNCGRKLGQLAACFVLSVEDSVEQIFDALKYTAIIHRSGGGTGFDFSLLRPKGTQVGDGFGKAAGPVSFMRIFNAATEEIKQSGVRRGANMGILRVDHPDIYEFIACKKEEGELRNFNISVAVTDQFIDAVQSGSDWPLSFKGEVYKVTDARELFASIVHHAHKRGDPGILFIDAINRANPTPALGFIRATNPCGEQPLLDYESCTLGSINLLNMVSNGAVDWRRLKTAVESAVRFLDNVIEINRFPLSQIAEATLLTRKIGLGVMGWADMLFRLGIPYDSEAALQLAEELMAFISETARQTSIDLARERGTFPAWRQSIYYPRTLLRNATLTTIAPTGSISAIAGTSSGIEPVYGLAYFRVILDQNELWTADKPFLDYLHNNLSREVREKVLKTICQKGSIQGLNEIDAKARSIFKTALEIDPQWHLRMQAAFQKHTDNAVSKTVNLPNNTTAEQVARIFEQAHELGLKGITVYRSGSRSRQPLNLPVDCRICR